MVYPVTLVTEKYCWHFRHKNVAEEDSLVKIHGVSAQRREIGPEAIQRYRIRGLRTLGCTFSEALALQ